MIYTDKKGVKHDEYKYSLSSCALCLNCKHFLETGSTPPTCAAFPDGISEDVWNGTVKHIKPIKGDRGIFYSEAIIEESKDMPALLYDDH